MVNTMPRKKCDTCGRINWGTFVEGDACSFCGQSLWNEYGKYSPNLKSGNNTYHLNESGDGEASRKRKDSPDSLNLNKESQDD